MFKGSMWIIGSSHPRGNFTGTGDFEVEVT